MVRQENHDTSTAGEFAGKFQQRKHMIDETPEMESFNNCLLESAPWKVFVCPVVHVWRTSPQFTAHCTGEQQPETPPKIMIACKLPYVLGRKEEAKN